MILKKYTKHLQKCCQISLLELEKRWGKRYPMVINPGLTASLNYSLTLNTANQLEDYSIQQIQLLKDAQNQKKLFLRLMALSALSIYSGGARKME